MSTILKEDLAVNIKGEAIISYNILKDFIDPTLKKVSYTFNDAENQIQIKIIWLCVNHKARRTSFKALLIQLNTSVKRELGDF